ncbi:MAG: hypothetical protein ACOYME_13860 [Prochlorotrichaceae cyanobacterium]|jgi:uncharacterized protein YqgC (DUF456 family)
MIDLLLPISHGLLSGVDALLLTSHHWVQLASDSLVLAQSTDADLVAEFQKAFKQFVESGQVWAMLIGLIIGYFFRALTTYG